jgi:hypothetical protein
VSEIRRGDGEATEVEALITDRYLDSLLTLAPSRPGQPIEDPDASLGAAVRAISRRLASDLPRFHPSFRFEERLALRLAQLAAAMRMPLAAGGESQATTTASIAQIQLAASADLRLRRDSLGVGGNDDPDRDNRPLLIGGAVAASALSLAGAWLARRRRPSSPMARAIRAAHAFRQPLRHG